MTEPARCSDVGLVHAVPTAGSHGGERVGARLVTIGALRNLREPCEVPLGSRPDRDDQGR